ncbi:MAG TPA: ATP-binding cassette domain-containing protein [Polyangiaceae bacterium]|nr:ATP-binding cassette domain-containing protein [Polyangiaceae bacterium]
MNTAILCEGLGKTYRRRKRKEGFWAGLRAYFSFETEELAAVSELTFRVERGESVGLIGENGAGKSTTVKMLTGILVPTAGRVETLGLVPHGDRRRLSQSIGVVFGQKPQLLWDIPARDSFELLKAMYRVPDDVYRFTYTEAVERLELGEFLDTPVRLLSLGQRMRCDLAASLLHAPAIAFLDEPTIGLDVLVKERVREHLVEMRRRFGTTIVLTTHDLKDISATCERLLVLDRGRLLYDGSRTGFEERYAEGRTLLVTLEGPLEGGARERLEQELAGEELALDFSVPRRLRIECTHATSAPRVTASVLRHLAVADLTVHGAELDAIVTRLYRNAKPPA